jgi:hypothetical protein
MGAAKIKAAIEDILKSTSSASAGAKLMSSKREISLIGRDNKNQIR